jgi:hypothetical protein
MKKLTAILLVLVTSFGLHSHAEDAAPKAVAAPAQPAPVTVSGKLTPIPFPTDTDDVEAVRQAGVIAVDQLLSDFLVRESQSARYAVMPLDRDFDDGYFTMQLRSELANRGKAANITVITRDAAMEKQFLAEIRRGDQIGDTMDPATIQKFGRAQGVNGIVVGRITGIYEVKQADSDSLVRLDDQYKRMLQVRISLQAYEVETGRQIWGAERSGMVRIADDKSIVIPGTRRDWLLYGGGAIVGGLLLLVLLGMIWHHLKSSFRPR